MRTLNHKNKRGWASKGCMAFTLVEMLVVVGLILVLIAILLPVLSRAREKAKASATSGTIGSISIAIEAYRSDMGQYPRHATNSNANISTSRCNYGYAVLASALVGFGDAATDGADGFGFRTSSTGRVYGPYLIPNGKNYKIFRSQSDLPNPVGPSGGTWTGQSNNNFGREWHATNQGFVDGWGQPIFYWVGNSTEGAQGQLDQDFFSWADDATQNNRSFVFIHCNPDAVTGLYYTINGVQVQSRLVPYTPAGKWQTATTPWGAATDLDGDRASQPNPMPGLKFRALIGASNPASQTAKSTDRIVGRNTFLLTSAGQDNQYFTGDEIINEDAR